MKYLALLRGINVGGNNKVEMKTLKMVFESLGFESVSTYINTGNVIFESELDGLDVLIETVLFKNFGFIIRVVVRSAQNIHNLCQKLPTQWTNDVMQKTDILFLWDDFDNAQSLDLIKKTQVDNLFYYDGAIVWNVNKAQYKQSGMNKFIGSKVYKNMTARNINTVRKLDELMNQGSKKLDT